MKQRILITGINGFIGKYLVKELIANTNYEIIGIGRKEIAYNFPYFQLNLEDENFVQKYYEQIKHCDIIIHLAAQINMNSEISLIKSNIIGTYNIIQLAKKLNSNKIIYLSSIPVIGTPVELPITEKHPTKPNTLYHCTKLAGENILRVECKNMDYICLRIASPIGVKMNTKTLLPIILKQCYLEKDIILFGKGTRKQNYIDVRDVIKAIILSINKSCNGIYNIRGSSTISNYDLAKLCIELTNSKSSILFQGNDPEENNNWEISSDKALLELNYKPSIQLSDTIQWIYKNIKLEDF